MMSKPTIAMLVLQFTFSAANILMRAALNQGMNQRVFIVYRQSIATLFMAPAAYISNRRKTTPTAINMKSLSMIFISSLVGVTINQVFYLQGMYMTSSSIASAMSNLVPAITFVMAAALGLEKVNMKTSRSLAKVLGTVICVLGASSMAFLKGHKLLNIESPLFHSIIFSSGSNKNWVLGCIYLFGGCCCGAFWLIMQVPILEIYPDGLSISAWMCFFAALQSGILTYFLETDPRAWQLSSSIEIFTCFFAGIITSGVTFFIESWCIAIRGPLFTAVFSPLGTVIVTISGCFLLHEELYIGSLAGAIASVAGLYAVLWGKAKDDDDLAETKGSDIRGPALADHDHGIRQVDQSLGAEDHHESLLLINCKIDLKKPLLLAEKLTS